MRILTVHNHYQQLGGEDTIFATESDLLESYGHQVRRYTIHNDQVKEMGSLALTKATLWNSKIYQDLRTLIRQEKPQVAHFHNTFPLISPAAYHAAQAEGVPVVQTLHNFRLLCSNGLFFRDGQICEDCLGKRVAWSGVIHGCYRDSRIASGAVTAMVNFHSLLGTWTNAVDVFIAYSHFALDKFIQGGLPKEKIEFKTNFLYPAPELGKGSGAYAMFAGRLSPEKGTGTLLEAWKQLGGKIPLKIVGDGPLGFQVAQMAQQMPGVEWLGRKPLSEVYEMMGEASFLVIASEWYETFGRVGIEALAKGTPLIVSDIGALAELVEPNYNGLRFRPGNSADLAAKVEWVLNHPEELSKMRHSARASFEAKYTAPDNYQRLMEIYELARSRQQVTSHK
ncbi:MAG: glycosyltransferase family 4 protein [Symploca sp. SIO2E9]|nr:glycosyltransferase family 4 protein [Symploca sp. SIO2E9]